MSITLLVLIILIILLIPTAYAGKIGAPYAPTRIAVVRKAFALLGAGKGDVLVDLGAGDGKIVIEADRHGIHAIGYELSPIMWFVAWLRVVGFPLIRARPVLDTGGEKGGWSRMRFGNFYNRTLPQDTTYVFVFLMPHNMKRLRDYLATQHLPKGKALLSYAFPIKEEQSLLVVREKNCAPLYVYDLQKLVSSN